MATPTIAQPNPTQTLTATVAPTAVPVVKITAVKGNLYIRRGPDLGFNPIAALMEGQSAVAIARDVLAKWVKIPIPGSSNQMGWISIQSSYSEVSGDVMSLPELAPTEWPVAAFLRNCTLHQMEVDPLGITLPAVTQFPNNEMPFNPGTYTVIDLDVSGHPLVLKVELREGSYVDIRVDGNGDKKKCPLP